MNILQALTAVALLVLGTGRTIVFLLPSLIMKKPVRLDLPIPGFEIDIVFVSDDKSAKVLKASTANGRLHEVGTKDLPKWAQLYFPATRFFDQAADRWFIPFEGEDSNYPTRRAAIVELLAKGYRPEDVTRVAELASSSASDDDLAAALDQVVVSRFLQAGEIPRNVTVSARDTLNGLLDALKPGRYGKAVQGVKDVLAYVAANHPAAGLQNADALHNLGSVAVSMPGAVRALQKDLGSDLQHIFTKTKNCPTKNVPRVALESTTFGDLLFYPAKPGKTIFLISISRIAEATGSLWYTFGSGDDVRACPFKPFFEGFMADLQAQLRSRGTASAYAAKEL